MPFSIDHDPVSRLARIEMRGFWTRATLDQFKAAASTSLQNGLAAGLTPGEGSVLVVMKDTPVQDKALTDDLANLIPLFGRLARRVAVVADSSALVRLQARRLVADNGKVFNTEAEAMAWLSE